ncbi:hypothetical protein EsH8_X_000051 [Colletotrichum jinshuiense]
MSDPLSIATGLIALIQVTAKATEYLKDVKDGGKERTKLRDELRGVTCLLEMIHDRVEEQSESDNEDGLKPAAIALLAGPDGPLERMKATMEEVVSKLAPQAGLRRLAQPFRWPFEKKDILELFGTIERLKSHFTLVLQSDILTISKLTSEKVHQVGRQLDDMDLEGRRQETEKILCWISSTSFRSKQADVLQSVQPGTGKWFLEAKEYRDWLSGNVNLLWCPGIPGAGKTRLASLVIDALETHLDCSNSLLAYVYCDNNNRESQTQSAIVSSLLEYILQRTSHPHLPEVVRSLYAKHAQKGTRPTTKQLSEVFTKLFSSCNNVFIVIDALDECASSDMVALELVSALQALGDNVRLLLTSRTSTNFEGFFKDAVRIEITAKDEDVRLYLERRIPKHSRLAKHIRADPKLQDDIITSIAESAQGMFLLATLNLDFLSRKLTRRDVRSSLSILPKTLDATYEQALERIRTQAEEDVELAETIILWILCARRPLGVHELQHMYAVHLLTRDEHEDEEMIMLEDDDLPPEDIVTGVCGSFIVVDSTSKTTRLVHYTAQDYLSRTLGEHLDKTRLELTRISLEYLQLLNFQEGPALSDSAMAERLANFTFLDYAARYWGAELEGLRIEDFWGSVDRFLSNEVAVSVASQIWSLPRYRYANWSNEFPKGVPAIVLAASFQTPNVLERLVGQGKDIEGRGSDKETTLIRSARLGHEENITALLRLGADVAATDIAGETAIDVATLAGKASAVKALIDGGANVNTVPGAEGWSLLMSAVSSGSIKTVQLLIESGANVATQTSWGETALSLAALSGQEAIANLLIDSGAILPLNRAGRRATLQASRKGLSTLASRLSSFGGDYGAVVDAGIPREPFAAPQQLAQIAELEEVPTAGMTDSEIGFSLELALDGFSYQRGFHRRYDIAERLGKGHFAEVFFCARKTTGVCYAVKIFTIDTNTGWTAVDNNTSTGAPPQEIRALTSLRHPHMVNLVEVLVSDAMDQLCLVLELAPQGELFNFLIMKQKLTEEKTRCLFHQLLSALEYIHKEGWIHRDIKPENILMQSENSIKLADFGLAVNLSSRPEQMDDTLCGTPSYVAPEILAESRYRRYSYPVDVWSTGVVLYICLCGFPPFSDELYSKDFPYTLSQQIKSGRFDYPSPYWDSVGDIALDLIDSMLVVNPEQRYRVEQCLSHPWMLVPDI